MSKKGSESDDFWRVSGDRLMGRLFDVFFLAEEPVVLDSLIYFVEAAPVSLNTPWDSYFEDLMKRAQAKAEAGDDDDKVDFQKAFNYWTRAYPQIADATRSGIITGFTAMADIMNGRGVRDLLSSGTNITPEQILSGKIVILDFPVKESSKGGLMIQAAWKLLFQQAIERRADKGLPSARPVFLWEDEGHEFFSQHDVRFQPTARDCRASHVILSQNLANFLQLGHNENTVQAVFAAMNTCVFHANVDYGTNSWAARRIGDEKMPTLKSMGLYGDLPIQDASIFMDRPTDLVKCGGFQVHDEIKPSVRPEEFSRLKKGGDGTCEAVVHWLSHRFAANNDRNFIKILFEQERR